MLTAPIPVDETDRLKELDKLDLLYTDGETAYDRVTRNLAKVFDAPAIMMNIIDRDNQYVKSSSGMPGDVAFDAVMPRKDSICGHVVGANETMIVEDLAADERFRDNPIVKARGLRFYAGAPLRTESGQPMGALCVVDTKPRHLSQAEQAILEIAAEELMRQARVNRITRELLDRNRIIERDLASARTVQRFLLPPPKQQSGGLKLSYHYHPLEAIGGDFLDTRWRPDGSMALLVADVSGHGATAALTSAMAKMIFQRAANQVADPAQLLTAVEAEMTQATEVSQFMTAVAAIFDPAAQTAALASAGHPFPMLLRHGKASVIDVVNDLPLMIEPNQMYTRQTIVPLHTGDRIIFCTDGATEAANPAGEMLTQAGLLPLIEANAKLPSEDMPLALFNAIRGYAAGHLRDDVALICAELSQTR
jgi:sigma-B regulation protein RsbU (phosphoserine phosphatase)